MKLVLEFKVNRREYEVWVRTKYGTWTGKPWKNTLEIFVQWQANGYGEHAIFKVKKIDDTFKVTEGIGTSQITKSSRLKLMAQIKEELTKAEHQEIITTLLNAQSE